MGEHYKIGGSTIKRTEICPGSVAAIAELPFKPGSAAAERGTRIHAYLEKYLKTDLGSVDKKLSEKDKEECLIAVAAGKVIKDLAAQLSFDIKDLIIEQKMKLTGISEDAGGTPDVGAFALGKDLAVWDLKAGRRYVEAENNYQLVFYAVCFWRNMAEDIRAQIQNVHMFIVQPEQEAPYEVHVRSWSISAAELSEWEDRFARIIWNQQANPHQRNPGDHCEEMYCDARHSCAQYEEWLDGRSLGLFSKLLQGQVLVMPTTNDEIATMLDCEKKVTDYFKQLKESAIATLKENPTAISGYGLVEGLGNRAWENEKFVEKKAKEYGLKIDDYKPRELVSPTAFEKLLKVNKIEQEMPPTVRASAGVKLVKRETTEQSLEAFTPPPAPQAPPTAPVVAPPADMFAGLI